MWWVAWWQRFSVSVAGQIDGLPHVLEHVLGVIGIVGTAISAYMIDRPSRLPRRRRSDVTRVSRPAPPDG
jgi:hypothetical protein